MRSKAYWLFYLLGQYEACCASGRFEAADSYEEQARIYAGRIIAGTY